MSESNALQNRFEELRIEMKEMAKQELRLLSAGSPFSPTAVAEVYREADAAGKMRHRAIPWWWQPAPFPYGVWSAQSLGDPLPHGA
jgi:hypothetical protein